LGSLLAFTSFSLLLNNFLLHARICSGSTLSLERGASITSAPSVQSLLQNSFLPSEKVVTVPAVASSVEDISLSQLISPANDLRVTGAIDKRLRSILRPKALVIKFPGIPHNLVHDLWQSDGVRRWAGSSRLECSATWVCDVRLVVWAVDIDSVPASMISSQLMPRPRSIERKCSRRKGNGCTNTATACAVWQRCRIIASAWSASEWILSDVGSATVAKLLLFVGTCSKHWVADDHTETLSSSQTRI
jgi:hypothetical protein